jgi:1-acyl-sn-glycerol-3-phosphate acyltransferase
LRFIGETGAFPIQFTAILFVENHHVFADIVVAQFLADHDVVIVSKVSAARPLLSHSTFHAALIATLGGEPR